MAEYNNTNPKISTSLISLFDETSNQLRIGGLENSLSVAIWIPEQTPEGKKTYPQNKRVSLILNADTLAALEYQLINVFLQAYSDGRDCNIAVYTTYNKSSMIQLISTNGDVYLRLNREISISNIPGETFTYKFGKGVVINNYDIQSGESDPEPVNTQFYLFCKTITAFMEIAVNSVAGHSERVANAYSNTGLFRQISAIAQKLGITTNSGSYGNSNNNVAGGNYRQNNYNNSDNRPQAPVQEVNNIAEFM